MAGVDEAGRGALAGPVVAAAVVLPYAPAYPFNDSKRLTAGERERLSAEVRGCALAWAVAWATPQEIDRINVLAATHLAAGRVLAGLSGADEGVLERRGELRPAALVTDYLALTFSGPVLAPPRADGSSYSVAAASLLAKTQRDRLMQELDAHHPAYAFASNKGYGSPAHLRGLAECGPCPEHRLSYAPVARARRS